MSALLSGANDVRAHAFRKRLKKSVTSVCESFDGIEFTARD